MLLKLVMLQKAYKDTAIGKTQVHEWFSYYKKGKMLIDNQPHYGHPSTSQMDENIESFTQLY